MQVDLVCYFRGCPGGLRTKATARLVDGRRQGYDASENISRTGAGGMNRVWPPPVPPENNKMVPFPIFHELLHALHDMVCNAWWFRPRANCGLAMPYGVFHASGVGLDRWTAEARPLKRPHVISFRRVFFLLGGWRGCGGI